MILTNKTYKYVVALVLLLHLPLTFMSTLTIEINNVSYPLPVLVVFVHGWLLYESRTPFVNERHAVHYFGIATGVASFYSNVLLHVIPNIVVIILGILLCIRWVNGRKKGRKRDGVLKRLKNKLPTVTTKKKDNDIDEDDIIEFDDDDDDDLYLGK